MVGLALVLLSAASPVDGIASSRSAVGIDEKYSGKQGQILVVKVPTEEGAAHVQGTFLGRVVQFFPETRPGEAEGFVGLLGIDLQDAPGTHELLIRVTNAERSRSLAYRVEVLKEKFRVEHLKLPKDKVDLDAKGLAR